MLRLKPYGSCWEGKDVDCLTDRVPTKETQRKRNSNARTQLQVASEDVRTLTCANWRSHLTCELGNARG